MPTFANPWYLLLLLLVPLLVWRWARRRRGTVAHPIAGQLSRLPSGRARWATRGGATLRFLAFSLLVLALAGPRWPDEKSLIHTEGVALFLAVDISQSMSKEDFAWAGKPCTRLAAVQHTFRLLVAGGSAPDGAYFEGRRADLVGLVSFAARPEAICPLTLSHSAVLTLLDREKPRETTGDAHTCITDAAVVALGRLRKASPSTKVLILLSDGEETPAAAVTGWDPAQVARLARALRVQIYTIDAGPAPEALDKVDEKEAASRRRGIETLEEMARLSGGKAFTARDTASLLEAVQAIDQRTRDTVVTPFYRRYHEAYPWVALVSFVLFVVVRFLDLTFWRRLPG